MRPKRVFHGFLELAQAIAEVTSHENKDFDRQTRLSLIPGCHLLDKRLALFSKFAMHEELFKLVEHQDNGFGLDLHGSRQESEEVRSLDLFLGEGDLFR